MKILEIRRPIEYHCPVLQRRDNEAKVERRVVMDLYAHPSAVLDYNDVSAVAVVVVVVGGDGGVAAAAADYDENPWIAVMETALVVVSAYFGFCLAVRWKMVINGRTRRFAEKK